MNPFARGLIAPLLLLLEALLGITIACGLTCGGGPGLVELTLLFLLDRVVLAGPTPPAPAPAAAGGPTLPVEGGRERDLERECC